MSRVFATTAVAVTLLLLQCATGAQGYYNAGANGTAAMGASLFNKLFAELIPVIEQVGPEIPIGPLSGSHYSIGQFNLNKLGIGGISVGFASPASLSVTITDLSVSVPSTEFFVFTKIFPEDDFKITCHGHVSGSASNANAVATVALSVNPDGSLSATVGKPTLSISSITTKIDMDGFCKIASGIIDLFHKEVDKLIDHEVQKLLPKKIQSIMQKEINKALPSFPLKFVGAPTATQDHLIADIAIMPPTATNIALAAAPQHVGAVMPHIFTNRDFSIGISMNSVNDIISSAAHLHGFDFNKTLHGKYNTSIFEFLIPQVFAKCPDCPFALYFGIQKEYPPTVVLGSESLLFSFNKVQLNFTAMKGTDEENLFSTITDLEFGVTNFTVVNDGTKSMIKFGLDLSKFSMTLGYSFIGPIDVSKFASFVQTVVGTVIVPLFNAEFKGFPLDLVYDGFGLDDWELDLSATALSLGANLLLPATQQELEMDLVKMALRSKKHAGHKL